MSIEEKEKMYQVLMDAEAGKVKYYRVISYDQLTRLLRGSHIDHSVSSQEEVENGYITIAKYPTGFSMKIFSEENIVIFRVLLSTDAVDELKILTECLTEWSTPDEIQQEPTPIHYIYTRHYFGIPKGSTFTVMSDWLNLDSPDNSLSTFITCTYWKDGKPEEVTTQVTKEQVRELIASGVIKEEPQSEDQQIYMKILKLYWSLSEEGRKEHFELVYHNPVISQYRYKMDEDVVISIPSKYAPYSDFVPSELYDQTIENPFEIFRQSTNEEGFDEQEDVVKYDLNLITTLEETNRLLRENNELIKRSMEIAHDTRQEETMLCGHHVQKISRPKTL